MLHGNRFLATLAISMMVLAVAMSNGAEAAKRVKAAIVVDAGTGTVLYSRRADTPIYPASLTKMMTLYLAFEAIEKGVLKMEQRLPVSRHAARQPRVKLGLRSGSTIKLREAIMSMIVRSSNDSAVVIAEAIGRTESGFARKMNAKAIELGMINTTFRNANGLPDRRQKSTARDVSTLALAIIRDFPKYYRLFSAETFVWNGRRMTSTNKLLTNYPGVDGLKTGYINDSGYNLAASAVRYNRRLVAVVIGGSTGARRDAEVQRVLSAGFKSAIAKQKTGQLARATMPPPRPGTPGADSGSTLASLARGVVSSAHAAPPPRPLDLKISSGDYGVQVGAYSTRDRAHSGARLAVGAAPQTLQNRPVSIDRIPNKVSSIYRARVLDLSLNEARQTCRELRQKSLDCMIVRTQ
ncbi:serine hydrolase [Minwuia sp.]|uniref:serine hydrolase n=1 Tax=Minwuia sp. TaxID=2493630 RepID=UPI003A927763